MPNPTLELAKQLIAQKSVTPNDANCQNIMAARLEKLDFIIEKMPFGEGEERVENLWARRGNTAPLFVFAGHTDVVPTGDENDWDVPPFEGRVIDVICEALHVEGVPSSVRETPNKKHIAVTAEPTLKSAEQVLLLYERIKSVEGVVMTM